jgi:hypothetical protein
MKCISIDFCAMHSLTLWYAMQLCFLVSVEVTTVAFFTMLSLSQYVFVGSVIGMPNILSFYCNASSSSEAIFSTTNSDPNASNSILPSGIPYDWCVKQEEYYACGW